MSVRNKNLRNGDVRNQRLSATARVESDSVGRLVFSAVSIGLGTAFLLRSLMGPASLPGLVGSAMLLQLGLYPACRMGVEMWERQGLSGGRG